MKTVAWLMALALCGCATSRRLEQPAACSSEGAEPPGPPNATRRADAVLQVLRGCDPEAVARRYGATPEVLQQWMHAFVSGGRGNLIPAMAAQPAELQAAWRGTWVLRSRIARGDRLGQVDGLMIFADDESLTLETGVLSDDFTELPLGPQAGQDFRLGQYSRLQYSRREGSHFVVRMSSSDLLGSYSDFPRGIHAFLVEPFLRRGDAFIHLPSPVQSYSPTSSDEIILLGDKLLIGWSNLDVVDTWERVSREAPPLGGARTLHDAWERLKHSRALLEKKPARTAELLGIMAAGGAADAAPAPAH